MPWSQPWLQRPCCQQPQGGCQRGCPRDYCLRKTWPTLVVVVEHAVAAVAQQAEHLMKAWTSSPIVLQSLLIMDKVASTKGSTLSCGCDASAQALAACGW